VPRRGESRKVYDRSLSTQFYWSTYRAAASSHDYCEKANKLSLRIVTPAGLGEASHNQVAPVNTSAAILTVNSEMGRLADHLIRVITGPHKWSAGDVGETHLASYSAQFVELFGRDITHNGQVTWAGLEILA
jgi:hypothetical protein